jgi:hypothetical protein
MSSCLVGEMMKPISLRTSAYVVVSALAVACASAEGGEDAASITPELEEERASVCPEDTPEFVTGAEGLTAQNDALNLKVRLDQADWIPPAKNYNTWEVAITDLAGAALPDAQITWACAWMPAHGHGTNPREIEKLPDGRISLVKQNLAMTGGWQVRLWIDPTGTAQPYAGGSDARSPNACSAPTSERESLQFDVCVPRDRGVD